MYLVTGKLLTQNTRFPICARLSQISSGDNPNVQIYMAKILPITSNYMSEDGGPASSVINGFVTALNDGLTLLAAELQSAQSPIVLVDMNSGFGNAQLPMVFIPM